MSATTPLPESAVELAARAIFDRHCQTGMTQYVDDEHIEYAWQFLRDTYIADVRAALPAIREAVVKEYAPVVAALETFMEWWDTEGAGPQWTTPERRDCPEGEIVWRKWGKNQLRLAALAPELGRAALAALTTTQEARHDER